MQNPFSIHSEMGIRKRVIALLFMIFVPFLLLEAHVYYRWYQERKEIETQANLELARSVAKNFETFLQGVASDELAVGLAITATRPMTAYDRDILLDEIRAANPAIRSIFWMDAQGVVLASSLRAYIGYDLKERSFFRSVVKDREWAVSELFIGWSTGRPAFTVSRAIRDDDDRLLGVVGAAIEPDRLATILGVGRWADAGVSLIDNKGMHVFRDPPIDARWDQRNWLERYPVIAGAMQGRDVMAEISWEGNGKSRLAAFAPIPSIGWVAACSRAESDVIAGIIRTLLPQMWFTLLLTLAGFGAAFGISQPITRSILKLRAHVAAFGRGETARVDLDGPIELKDFARTLNEMADKIRSREAALRESESLYRAIAENFPEGVILIFDHDLRFRVADGEAMERFRFRREAMEGRRIREAVDDETYQIMAERYPRVLAGESLRFETPLKGRIFSSAYVPIKDEQGSVIAGMIVSLDITERKRAEKQLLQAMKMSASLNRISAVVHATLDFDDIMQRIVAEGSTVLGCETTVALVQGRSWFVSHLQDPPTDLVAEMMKDKDRFIALTSESPSPIAVDDTFEDDRLDGDAAHRYHTRSMLFAPVIIRGDAVGVIFFNYHSAPHRFTPAEIDFARQVATIAGIALSNARLFKELEESNQELHEFGYALTHNLKAPLRAIRNYVSFLLEDLGENLKGEPKEYLDGLLVAVKQGEEQIADLENLYRIKSHEVSSEAFDLEELFDEMQFIFPDGPDQELVAVRPCPGFKGERFLLRQILIELIRNGFKFNLSRPKRVEIGCLPAADGSGLEFYVHDNGIGIAPHYHEQIFRIFQRLHTSSEYEGTGIGLAIVKRAVQKMGGTIAIDSMVDQGTRFTIRLPVAIKRSTGIRATL